MRSNANLVFKLFKYPLGRFFFRASILFKQVALFFGRSSQRAVEYPWLIQNLYLAKKNGLILDVGCAESLLSHELVAKGLSVVGIDVRDCLFNDKHLTFIKRNIIETHLPANTFDAIGIISTIEHIGLEPYGQTVKDSNGDLLAMKELHRILKSEGIVILTTPYIGNGPLKVTSFEREYDRQRLSKLIEGYSVVKDCYYFPSRNGHRFHWLKLSKEKIDDQVFYESGIACLVLKKAYA